MLYTILRYQFITNNIKFNCLLLIALVYILNILLCALKWVMYWSGTSNLHLSRHISTERFNHSGEIHFC